MSKTVQSALGVRQGDVLFKTINKLPAGDRKKRENGTIAYGEVTGHSHTVMSADQVEVLDINGGAYLVVNERGISIQHDADRIAPDLRAIVEDETETPLRRFEAQRCLDLLPQAGAIFLHGTEDERVTRPVPGRGEDRHLPVAIVPGVHEPVIQREWSPEAIRNVLD